MQLLREDACGDRRPHASAPPPSATRARAWAPVLLAPIAITASALAAMVAGLAAPAVVAVALAVAVAGGLVAHRTVSSVLAGLMLLLARPFTPGDRLRVVVAELGAVEAVVLRIGLVTTTLCTATGVLVLPNDQLLRAPAER
jgi:small-conductance mechanosensitive channel